MAGMGLSPVCKTLLCIVSSTFIINDACHGFTSSSTDLSRNETGSLLYKFNPNLIELM